MSVIGNSELSDKGVASCSIYLEKGVYMFWQNKTKQKTDIPFLHWDLNASYICGSLRGGLPETCVMKCKQQQIIL